MKASSDTLEPTVHIEEIVDEYQNLSVYCKTGSRETVTVTPYLVCTKSNHLPRKALGIMISHVDGRIGLVPPPIKQTVMWERMCNKITLFSTHSSHTRTMCREVLPPPNTS